MIGGWMPTPAPMDELCDDVAAEHDALDGIVADGDRLDVPTPAPGWTVGDQISHLWFFDQRAMMALTDPEAFAADAKELLASMTATGGTDASADVGRGDQPRRPAGQLAERIAPPMLAHARTVDPKVGVPWYGPP